MSAKLTDEGRALTGEGAPLPCHGRAPGPDLIRGDPAIPTREAQRLSHRDHREEPGDDKRKRRAPHPDAAAALSRPLRAAGAANTGEGWGGASWRLGGERPDDG